MNARTLSGSIRAGSSGRGRVTFQAARSGAASPSRVTARASDTPAASPAPAPTETRGGVLYVVDRLGVSPVASPAIAESYGRALRGLGLT